VRAGTVRRTTGHRAPCYGDIDANRYRHRQVRVMTNENMEVIEATRARYRPARVTTLFVGESAPASGEFFYHGNTGMTRHMQTAVESALGESSDFLERFKSYGWYLDDLVLTPVNRHEPSERKAKCLGAQSSLAGRIAKYQPLGIVSLMLGIRKFVDAAATQAGCNACPHAVHFPGNGQQGLFLTDMATIIHKLPRLTEPS